MAYQGTTVIQGIRFVVYDVPKDGNCLFAAFSYGLIGSIGAASSLRQDAVKAMRQEWDRLGTYTDHGNFQPYPSYEAYAESMSKDGTYAGAAEIEALIVDFDRRVRVYQDNILVDTFNPNGAENIDLLFVRAGLHYKCLKEVRSDAKPSPQQPPLGDDIEDDVLYTFPETNYDMHTRCQLYDVRPRNQDEDDMFADFLPNHYPTCSSKPRPLSVKDLPEHADKRCSLALSSAIGNFYMWAGLYDGERVQGTRPVTLGEFSVECADCGALYYEAEQLFDAKDVPAWCCGKTIKSNLSESARFRPISDPMIREWYYGKADDALHFQAHIREYNHALSIAVPVTNYTSRSLRTGRVISLNGRVTFECDATVSADLRAGQLYFVNMTRDVIDQRMLRSEVPLREHILERLERYMRRHNDLVRTFELAGNLQRRNSTERVSLLINPHRDGFRVTDREYLDTDPSARRPPGSNFVAAAYVGNRVRYSYDVALFPRCGNDNSVPTRVVHEASPSLDTLLYPLIHLHAEDPWVEMRVDRRRAQRPRRDFESTSCGTNRDYYASRIMIRGGDEGVLHQSRALYQQWLCDAAVKIEDNALNYAEQTNAELHVCQLDSLKRFVASEAAGVDKNPGRVVIIPQNIQTSERAMYNNYMDSVRISMEFGSPAMLMTFTTNPRWPEITQQLTLRGLGWDEYVNAPDIVVRVYLARLNVAMSDVINRGVFGRVLGYSGVHEYTSTMLPHFHMAVILDPADVPRTPDEVDALVSAEIPSQEDEPDGFIYVMKHMIHRPCDGSSPGYTNPLCRPNGVPCTAGFPYPFIDKTVVTRRGPILRRRETTPVYSLKHRCMVDNRWVVPYNLKMGLRTDNHLNFMLSGENLAYKYLYGYFTKESRGQCVQGGMLKYFRERNDGDAMDWDEISHFKDLRVIGPYEAVFKILGVPVARLSHSVQTLPIHLPGKQYVYYRGDANRAAELGNTSKLEAWFNLNARDPSVGYLFYAEIVNCYRWSKGEWVPKARSNTLGRLMHVNPSPRNMELFFLRLLLLNRPGMTSFKDVLTVDGEQYGSFQAACQALGIGENESVEYGSAMEEVAAHAAPYQIRAFFATIVAMCHVSNAESLWKTYRLAMSNDYVLRGCARREALVRARRDVLHRIDCIRGDLPVNNQFPEVDLDDSFILMPEREPLHLHVPVRDTEEDATVDECTPGDDELINDLSHDVVACATDDGSNNDIRRDTEMYTAHAIQYTEEQRTIHDEIMQAVESQSRDRANFFSLEAPAGCGKTFIYQGLLLDCRRRRVQSVPCAMTALAALLLENGDTCHRTFGIPIRARQDGTDRSFIECSSDEADRLRKAGLIVIDEMSMLARWQIILIDRLLRDIMSSPDTVFGGKVVLVGGDMGQILPVLKNASSSELIANALPSWENWCLRKQMVLTKNMRAQLDPQFAEWTMAVRDGSANVVGTDDIRVPPEMLVSVPRSEQPSDEHLQHKSRVRSRDEYLNGCALIEKVYGDMSSERLRKGIILSPTNEGTRAINNIVMQGLTANSRTYIAKTSVVYQDRGQRNEEQLGEFLMTTEELESIHAANLPPHHLNLKVGGVVMLLLNIDKKNGLCNGARFIVTKLLTHAICLRRLSDHSSETPEIYMPRMKMRSDDVPVAGSIERFQFPVTPAFAVTINKSQGQTFEKIGLFLRRPVFTHGQFYVAVGRAKQSTSVHIVVMRGALQGPHGGMRGGRNVLENVRTKNIVYQQVLQ